MQSKSGESRNLSDAEFAKKLQSSQPTITKDTTNHCPSCGCVGVATGLNIDLRSYFAGKALCIIHGVERSKLLNPSDVARHAYTIADAMLQEKG